MNNDSTRTHSETIAWFIDKCLKHTERRQRYREIGKEKKMKKKNVEDYTWTKIQMFPVNSTNPASLNNR